MKELTIGIDIGGTFTDVLAMNEHGAVAGYAKVPSTPDNPARAVLAGVNRIVSSTGAVLTRLVHSSTVSLNAIIEQKGARLGIITNRGFEDILIIGRQKRTDMYDLFLDPETPVFLCPRERIIGISGRLDRDGQEVDAVDAEEVRRAVAFLVEEQQVEAIAVCLLFSYLNPDHEILVRDLIKAAHPGVSVSVSSEVDPQMREYERLVMTAFDAYLKPVAGRYLSSLDSDLSGRSHPVNLQIMQSRGVSSAGARRRRDPSPPPCRARRPGCSAPRTAAPPPDMVT